MSGLIFTIGHSNHSADRLLALLRQHDVALLADIRSQPTSRHAPQFNRMALTAFLSAAGIVYRWLGDRLGGRPREPAMYGSDGRTDYAKLAAAAAFQAGIEDLIATAADRRTAIMCAERDPLHCHRRALVAPALLVRGVEVEHILADGTSLPDAALQRPAKRQLDLFG